MKQKKMAPRRSGARSSVQALRPPRKQTPARGLFEKRLADLKMRLAEVADLGGAMAVLGWDQATYMPRGGAGARGRQLATLGRLAHERLTDVAVGRLLDQLDGVMAARDADDNDAALVRVARRDFERAQRVPSELVGEIAHHGNQAYAMWAVARSANDFDAALPFIENGVRLARTFSACFKPTAHVLDPLIAGSDPGLTTSDVNALFGQLKSHLVPLVARARAKAVVDDACIKQHFPEAKQLAFAMRIAERVGYDLVRGRIDVSPHPFSTTFGHGDVRITTRVKEHDFSEAFYSTLHEVGHALYEQGVAAEFDGTPLAGGASAGVHESQSRLWENIVGRGEAFLGFVYPLLQKEIPAFKRIPLATFQRAINRVTPSLIRTDADELTYNLHVIVRFDLERRMLEGTLKPKDLPQAWSDAYADALGVTPTGHADGCLQDVHWYSGLIGGGFQGYAIGNILAAQFYEAAIKAQPGIPGDISKGRFRVLHGWLVEAIYRHGRKYLPAELVHRTTGKPMTTTPYVTYLESKYSDLGLI